MQLRKAEGAEEEAVAAQANLADRLRMSDARIEDLHREKLEAVLSARRTQEQLDRANEQLLDLKNRPSSFNPSGGSEVRPCTPTDSIFCGVALSRVLQIGGNTSSLRYLCAYLQLGTLSPKYSSFVRSICCLLYTSPSPRD